MTKLPEGDAIALTVIDNPEEFQLGTSPELPGVLILMFPKHGQAVGFRGEAAAEFFASVGILASAYVKSPEEMGLTTTLDKKLLN